MEVIQAPAKLNVSLRVLGKTPDGYHELEMVNAPISLADVLTVSTAPDNSSFNLRLAGDGHGANGEDLGVAERNILFRAHREFCAAFDVRCSVDVKLEKNIPVGAGLGGGSSDAAALLMLLASKYLNVAGNFHENQSLMEVAKRIGADVPFFLARGACFVSGIGEKLSRIPLPALDGYRAAVFAPPVSLSTKRVFETFAAMIDRSEISYTQGSGAPGDRPIDAMLSNDLLSAAAALEPVCGELVVSLRRAGFPASLTGSGSAVFALVRKDRPEPEQLALIGSRFACRVFHVHFLNT